MGTLDSNGSGESNRPEILHVSDLLTSLTKHLDSFSEVEHQSLLGINKRLVGILAPSGNTKTKTGFSFTISDNDEDMQTETYWMAASSPLQCSFSLSKT